MSRDRGAEAAFLAARHDLLAYLLACCRDPHQAEDLLQEVWVALRAALEAGQEIGNLIGWCRAVGRHAWLRERRHQRRERAGDAAVAAALDRAFAARPRDEVDWSHHLQALRHCLDLLDASARALLGRRFIDETPLADLSRQAGLEDHALTMRLSRLRARLRQCVAGRLRAEGLG